MINPKVSVLVPVYNGGRHLKECLDSILEQDFAALEILISDDGSDDDSPEIIQDYAARDRRIRCWKNPRNLGLTGNSNACLREARGEYVKFVHQDDKLLSASVIFKMAAALDAHPSAVLVGSRQHLTGTKSKPLIFSRKSGLYNGRRMIVASLEQNTNLIGQPSLTMFRRRAAHRGFDDRFTGFLDFEMWCHLLEQGDFIYLAEALATWRVHQNHQTARARTSGVFNHEHLLFMEIYYAKPWLQKLATDRMRFSQIYNLEKKNGKKAWPLTSIMWSQLALDHYAWQWLKHKGVRPFQRLGRRAGWTSQLLVPRAAGL